jgi:hypothetical protein
VIDEKIDIKRKPPPIAQAPVKRSHDEGLA